MATTTATLMMSPHQLKSDASKTPSPYDRANEPELVQTKDLQSVCMQATAPVTPAFAVAPEPTYGRGTAIATES